MLQWKKLGKIFDPIEYKYENWMYEFAQSPSVLIYDDYVRIYFCSRPKPDDDGLYLSYLSSIDLDRKDLKTIRHVCEKPLLELGGFGTFDEFGTNPISVIRIGDEVRVYYAGWTRCESVPFNGAIGVAVSHDEGLSFTRLGKGPVLSYSPDEPFLIGSPRIRFFNEKFYLWYVAGKEWLKTGEKPEPVYKIRMASSDDGITWEKYGLDLIEDKLGIHECQACPDVIFRDGKYHMFFSYRYSHNYKTNKGGYRIGYAYSDDMIHWSRCDEMVGFDVSKKGWDCEMVNYPHVFFLDGDTYMLYQGNEMGRTGIGLAVLQNSKSWIVK